MNNLLTMLTIVVAITFTSCNSKSRERADKIAKENAISLKIPLSLVTNYKPTEGGFVTPNNTAIVQYYNADSTLITVGGYMYQVQDTIMVTNIISYRQLAK